MYTRIQKYGLLMLLLLMVGTATTYAQKRKVQNRPYIDQRVLHYGFSFGFQSQDLELRNNGYIDPETGELWLADVDNFNPGFNVGVLADLRLHNHLNLRVAPTMYFGQKHVVFKEFTSGRTETQNLKSTYFSVPVSIKFSAPRFNNYRPYLIAGICPALDLTGKRQEHLSTKRFDCWAEFGMGIDLYMPFFKLIPELKFCFGLADILEKDRSDLTDQTMAKYTLGLDRATSGMIVLSFYFE